MRWAVMGATLVLIVMGATLWLHPVTSSVFKEQLYGLFAPPQGSGWTLVLRGDLWSLPEGARRSFISQRLDQLIQRSKQMAHQHPDDWRFPLAVVILELDKVEHIHRVSPSERDQWLIEQLCGLSDRFPDCPEIPATLFRYLWLGVSIRGDRSTPKYQRLLAQLPRFVELTYRAERADPENAYFPQVRACLLALLGRTEEAIAVWQSAAQKNRWDDYALAEVEALAHLTDSLGYSTSAGTFLACMLQRYPHYPSLREFSREVVKAKANALRKQGDWERANALLLANARNSALITMHSRSSIGFLVGKALLHDARRTLTSTQASPSALRWVIQQDTQLEPLRNAVSKYAEPSLKRLMNDINQAIAHLHSASQRLAVGLLMMAHALLLAILLRLRTRSALIFLVLLGTSLLFFYLIAHGATAFNLSGVTPIDYDLILNPIPSRRAPQGLWDGFVDWLESIGLVNPNPIMHWELLVVKLWLQLIAVVIVLIALRWLVWKRTDRLWHFVQGAFFWLAFALLVSFGILLWRYAHLERDSQSALQQILSNETRYFADQAGVRIPTLPPSP